LEVVKMGSDIKIRKKNVLSYVMLAVAVLLLVVSVVQAYQIASMGKAENTASATGVLDTAGWTADEKMNYEMHGIIPARVSGGAASPITSQAAQQAPAMVGGC
jgi:hypothetical protein